MNLYSRFRDLYRIANKNPLISKIKNIYNSWYWRERKVQKWTLRNPQHSVNYYIIRRYAQNMGLGSYIISNLSQINYALQKGMVPVIDMLNYNGTVMEQSEYKNTWELYFEQPFVSLAQAYHANSYYLSDGACKSDAPNDSMSFLCDMDVLQKWQRLFKKHIIFNQRLKTYMENEYQCLLKGKGRVAGVLCRGTDYVRLRPKGHPVQPETDIVLKQVNRVMRTYHCEYVYLATEDQEIENAFRRQYGHCLIVNKRVYKNYKDGFLANVENQRKDDWYHTNVEYLSSLYLLSRCNCFIAGRTSGTVITMLMPHQFEYTYFWDLGAY